jgi:hypothetical protein
MEEIWKDIKGFEGYYQVSNHGKIKSLSRSIINSKGIAKKLSEKILKPRPNKDGYVRVCLYSPSSNVDRLIHLIVAEHFIPKVDGKHQINHINGVKHDNHVSNLEWCTPSENIRHSFDELKREVFFAKGSEHPNSKLNEEKVYAIRKALQEGVSFRKLAKKYGVNRGSIGRIKHGLTWKHVKI